MAKGKLHLVGSAHLDPIWLWRWQEGCGEVLQTFRSALDRLNEYDDFVFTCSSAAYYKWVEDIDPDMFEEIRARVKEGRWVPVNGWWIQPDCNIPSGESFARQALYSQLYYYEKFGITCKTGYNVDSFGHSGMLPQLLRLGGMDSYVMHRPGPSENPDVPDRFLWESPDGSKVIVFHIPESYTSSGKESLDRRIENLNELSAKNDNGSMIMFYGVGNHGGGPTRADIEYLQTQLNADGRAEMIFSDPDTYFTALCDELPDLPIWRDDLQHHASGCYSATSLVKQLNRRAENSLYASEAFSTIAAKDYGMKPAEEKYKEAWREVCFNQFHDILCGCSIMEAYDDVRDTMGHAMSISDKLANEAYLRIAHRIDTWIEGVSEPYSETRSHDMHGFMRPVVVFNPLSFEINVPVQTYNGSVKVTDSEGNDVTFQNVRSSRSNDTHKDTLFMAKIPALGYATYWMLNLPDEKQDFTSAAADVSAEGLTMENENLKVTFDEKTGFIVSLVDLKSGYEWAGKDKPLAVPTVIDDHETDTWAHNVFTFHKIAGIPALESIELVEKGPARAVIRVKHHYGESHLTQDFILGSEQKTLRVKCKAIWQEKFTLLKMSFPVNGTDAYNTYDIPGGFIKRPVNGEEEPAGRYGAITVEDGGLKTLAVLNDSKYSYDCPGNDLRITLMRNVIFADHYSPRPAADFNFTDEGKQVFEYGIFVGEGRAEDTAVAQEAAMFNIRPWAVPESYHKGDMPQRHSFIYVNQPNINMTAFKRCEDGTGAVVARFAETAGRETRANIICDLLDAGFRADFRPLEIKTFRIDTEGKVTETDFLEGISEKIPAD